MDFDVDFSFTSSQKDEPSELAIIPLLELEFRENLSTILFDNSEKYQFRKIESEKLLKGRNFFKLKILHGICNVRMCNVSRGKREVNWFYIKLRVTTFHCRCRTWKITWIVLRNIEHVASIPVGFEGLIESFNAFVCYSYLSLTVCFLYPAGFYIDYLFQWNPVRGKI